MGWKVFGSACFDFDKGHYFMIACDDVNFTAAGAIIAFKNGIPVLLEPRGDCFLSLPPQGRSWSHKILF
jgi:hypothetical protein